MEQAVVVGCSCLLTLCCGQLDQYIIDAGRNVTDLANEAGWLAGVRMDVEKKVEATERRRERPAAATLNWVARSKAFDEEAKKVLTDHAAIRLPRLNIWSRYRIGKRALRKLHKARGLIEEKPNLEASRETGHRDQEMQIETAVVGMDPYMERALEYIGDDTVGVIGICGMGGVGKTTLLRKIHGEFLPGMARRTEFDKVVWALVHKKSATAVGETENNIARLQNDIAKQLGLALEKELPEYDSSSSSSKQVLEHRAKPIYDYLSNKSFLLLLDDLWTPLELKSIGVPMGGPPCDLASTTNGGGQRRKVVLTSRSELVCSQMQAARGLISVHCLNEDDAWRLFEFNVTRQTIASHEAIERLAREVMVECQGLPLALNTIGKALAARSGELDTWRDALQLSSLAKLKYLLAATIWLTTVPHGIISNCKQLQTLDVFGSQYAAWTWTGGDSESDKCASIHEFEANGGYLKWFGLTLDSPEAVRKLAMCSNVRTRRLCLTKIATPAKLHVQLSSLQELIGRLDILKSLQMFKANSWNSLSQLLVDGGDQNDSNLREHYCLPALEVLELIGMNSLENIQFSRMTASAFFPRLHSLTIINCPKLKNLNWTLYLPELLHLQLQFCPGMEALIQDTDTQHQTTEIEEQQDTFPVLKTLTIHSLKKLTSLCHGRLVNFPALQVMSITQCTRLTQLSIRPQRRLREIRGGEEWWKGLQWEEPSVEQELLPYFRTRGQSHF